MSALSWFQPEDEANLDIRAERLKKKNPSSLMTSVSPCVNQPSLALNIFIMRYYILVLFKATWGRISVTYNLKHSDPGSPSVGFTTYPFQNKVPKGQEMFPMCPNNMSHILTLLAGGKRFGRRKSNGWGTNPTVRVENKYVYWFMRWKETNYLKNCECKARVP